jgi:YspA, cpYpsA-related SLOG family
MTRVLVCGGRNYGDYWTVREVLDGFHASCPVALLIEGGALGADRFARKWAQDRGVPVATFEADWSLGRSAGPMRNRRMLVDGKPHHVIAFPGGRGTENMVLQAKRAGVPVTEISE